MRRFVTANSVYVIDEDGSRYMRSCRPERDRTPYESLVMDASWRLEDGAWIPLREWRLEALPEGGQGLRLFTPDAVHGVLTSAIEGAP